MDRRARMNRERKAKQKAAQDKVKKQQAHQKAIEDSHEAKKKHLDERSKTVGLVESDSDGDGESNDSDEVSSDEEGVYVPHRAAAADDAAEEDGDGDGVMGNSKYGKDGSKLPFIDKKLEAKKALLDFQRLANPNKKKTKKQLAKEEEERKKKRLRIEREEREKMDPKDAAYRAFSMIDADGSGRVTVRELARYISGQLIDSFDCRFPVADTGMAFDNDVHGNIIVNSMEAGSPADVHPDMDRGLRVLLLNGESFGNKRGQNIKKLKKFLKTITEGADVVFTFKEPVFVCGEYSCFIEIQVEGSDEVHSIQMEDRAYPDANEFVSLVNRGLQSIEELDFIFCYFLADEERVVLRSTDELRRFRLMGETGPNSNANCHSIMGFGVADTEWTDEAVGLPKSMDLKLGLSIEDTKTIAQELMDLYDKNDNSLFEFDEFCDLYNVYLVSQEHENKLRKYARHKFRTPEEIEAERYARRYKRMMDKRQRKLLESRAKNKMIHAEQKEKRRHMYYRDEDGNFRKHTAQMMDQLHAEKHHREMEENSWMGLLKTVKKPHKKRTDGSTRKLVSMTAAKMLRRAGLRKDVELEKLDVTHGRIKTLDIVAARKQREGRDPQKVRRREQMEYRKKTQLAKIRRERDAAREHEALERAENDKVRHQMADSGMEEMLGGEKVTGADVGHPAWLGFIPLPRRSNDAATRSPVHFNMRAMRPDKEPAPHDVHGYVHTLYRGPERYRQRDDQEAGKRYHRLKEELTTAAESHKNNKESDDRKAVEIQRQSFEALKSAVYYALEKYKRTLPPQPSQRPTIADYSERSCEACGAGAHVYKRRVWSVVEESKKLKSGDLVKIRVRDDDPEVPMQLRLCRVLAIADNPTLVTVAMAVLDKSDMQGTGGVGSLEVTNVVRTVPATDVLGELDPEVWVRANWDWIADWDIKPAWMEEERLTVSEVASKVYREQREGIPAPGADPDDSEEERLRNIEKRSDSKDTFDLWTWAQNTWQFISTPRPQWMLDVKSVASNAKAEQELEQHNRGLREKSSAAVAEASQKKKKKLTPKSSSEHERDEGVAMPQHGEIIRRKRKAWTVYPVAPIGHGRTKQEYPHYAEQYDAGEIVHPSCYGYVIAGGSDHPRFIHPAFMGYDLRRAPMSEVPLKRQELFFRMRKGDKLDACPVCLSNKIGCPYCWDFPADWDPVDFEFKGPKVSLYGAEEPNLKLHTMKTTEDSIRMLRHLQTNLVELFIRTIPAGIVFRTVVEPDCTVGYLHFLHRSNTPFGNQPHQVLVIPTMKGMYFMDNKLIPETDLALGVFTTDVQLQRYGLRRDKARVCLLHYHYYDVQSMVRPLEHYIEHNTYMDQQPSMEIFHRLGGINDEVLSKDKLQNELLGLFEEQRKEDAVRDHRDAELQRRELWEKAHADLETKRWRELKEHRIKVNEAYHKRKAENCMERKSAGASATDLDDAGGFIIAVARREEDVMTGMLGFVVEKCNLLKGGYARGLSNPLFIVEHDSLQDALLQVQDMFKELDKTGHGYFSVADFKDILNNTYGKPKKDKRWTLEAEWDPEMDATQMEQVMKLADPENSGEVYYEPFVQGMGMFVSCLKADMRNMITKSLKEKQRAKESALKLKPEVLASPEVASNATTSEKLMYHLRVPGLSGVQRQLQHVLAMETQLYNMTHAADTVQVTTLNPKAIKKMEGMIKEAKGDLKHMQGTSMRRNRESIEDIFEMHRLEDKVWKIQNTIQKAYATKAAAIKKAMKPQKEETPPSAEDIRKKKMEDEAERLRKEMEPEPISMGSLDDGPVQYMGGD